MKKILDDNGRVKPRSVGRDEHIRFLFNCSLWQLRTLFSIQYNHRPVNNQQHSLIYISWAGSVAILENENVWNKINIQFLNLSNFYWPKLPLLLVIAQHSKFHPSKFNNRECVSLVCLSHLQIVYMLMLSPFCGHFKVVH